MVTGEAVIVALPVQSARHDSGCQMARGGLKAPRQVQLSVKLELSVMCLACDEQLLDDNTVTS